MKPIVHIYPTHQLAKAAAMERVMEVQGEMGWQMRWHNLCLTAADGQETWFRGVADWNDVRRLLGTRMLELHNHGCEFELAHRLAWMVR